MNTEKFLTFSKFSFFSIAVGVTKKFSNFFNFFNFKYTGRGYYHYPPTYQDYPPYSITKKDSYLDLHNPNKFYFLVCG